MLQQFLTVLNVHTHLLSEAINCLNQAIDIYTDMVGFVSVYCSVTIIITIMV